MDELYYILLEAIEQSGVPLEAKLGLSYVADGSNVIAISPQHGWHMRWDYQTLYWFYKNGKIYSPFGEIPYDGSDIHDPTFDPAPIIKFIIDKTMKVVERE